MSTISPRFVTCFVCGTNGAQLQLLSVYNHGSADLDLRPPEMTRSTMYSWLGTCPECGYVSEALDAGTPEAAAIVRGDEYQARWSELRKTPEKHRLARTFLLRAFLDEQLGRPREAATAFRQAAWCFDDSRQPVGARAARRAAAQQLATYLTVLPPTDEKFGTQGLVLIDLLRRAGDFGEAQAWIERLRTGSDAAPIPEIIAFQAARVSAQDTNCYTVADVLGDD